MAINYERKAWLCSRQAFYRRQRKWERMPIHKRREIEARRKPLKPGELREANQLPSGVKMKVFAIEGKFFFEFTVGTPDETRLPSTLANYDYTRFEHGLSVVTFGSKNRKIALLCALDYLSRLLDWAYWGDLIALEIHGGDPARLWQLVEAQVNGGLFNFDRNIAKLAQDLPSGDMADPEFRHTQTNYDYLWTTGKYSNTEAYEIASRLFSKTPTPTTWAYQVVPGKSKQRREKCK